MKFKWVRAKNFLSIGEQEVRIDFDKLKNIVSVKGKNLDVSPESSNGSGKSTCSLEILVYGLFGKLVKGLPHKEAINKKTKGSLEVEVCFELDDHVYKILRKRDPDDLIFWEDDVKQKLGGMPATQQAIESVIKLNYKAFINIVCFGEHNNHAFLACDAAAKRSIVENLLGLEKYEKFCKTAKTSLKSVEDDIKVINKEYEDIGNQIDGCKKRLVQIRDKQKTWKNTKEREIQQLKSLIVSKTEELNKTDDGKAALLFEEAQNRIKTSKDNMVILEGKRTEMSALAEQVKTKYDQIQESKNAVNINLQSKNYEISIKETEIRTIGEQIKSLGKLTPGVKCSACFGTVDKSNYQHLIDHNNSLLEDLKRTKSVLESEKSEISSKLQEAIAGINKISEMKKNVDNQIVNYTTKINSLMGSIHKDSQVKQPLVGSRELLLKEQIAELNNKIDVKTEELENSDPYLEIIQQNNVEINNLVDKINKIETQLLDKKELIPYYEFWVHGFGDEGIRAFIIDDILPTLNARINYWLQFLIDNKITLKFDNQFNATIERNPPDGDPFVYNATSGGERRRINLAISQAFAHVMMLSANTCPSVIVLDEVGINVDSDGMVGIHKMICELSKERQVFITTHDQYLNDLLDNSDVIQVVKKDGFTTVVDI